MRTTTAGKYISEDTARDMTNSARSGPVEDKPQMNGELAAITDVSV